MALVFEHLQELVVKLLVSATFRKAPLRNGIKKRKIGSGVLFSGRLPKSD